MVPKRGLDWLVEKFGYVEGAIAWAFKHQSKNRHGEPPAFRDVVTPDREPPEKIDLHNALADFDQDDYLTVSGQVLSDVRERVGRNWPVLVLGFNTYDSGARLGAALEMRHKIKRKRGLYPRAYFIAVTGFWRTSGKVRPSLLVRLSEVSRDTENRWRGDITERLNILLDDTICKI